MIVIHSIKQAVPVLLNMDITLQTTLVAKFVSSNRTGIRFVLILERRSFDSQVIY